MNRTTILLNETLKMKVMRLAKLEGISFGQFIRESLEMRLKEAHTKRKRDCFYEDTSVFTGKSPDDLSVHHDDYLY